MTIRLHRIFNLFRREFQRNCLILGCIFLILPLLVLILLGAFHVVFVLPLIALNLLGFFSLLLGYPKKAEFRHGALTYTENYEISKGERRRLHFRITEIRQVEYVQNKLEKRLNIGRIRFRGTAEIEPAQALKERKIVFFELCGIPNFDSFSDILEKELKKTTENKIVSFSEKY